MAADASSFDHPGHLLTSHHYGEESSAQGCSCSTCERVIAGAGYRCGECGCNMHEACLALPMSYAAAKEHPEHKLTLSRLTARATCDVCKVASPAGYCMYVCTPCNFNVHPRCTPVLAAAAAQLQHQHQQPPQQQKLEQRKNGTSMTWLADVFSYGCEVGRFADEMVAGGIASGVIDMAQGASDLFATVQGTAQQQQQDGVEERSVAASVGKFVLNVGIYGLVAADLTGVTGGTGSLAAFLLRQVAKKI